MATAMASQPHHHHLGGGEPRATSTSTIYTLEKVYGFRLVCKSAVDLKYQKLYPRTSKRKCCVRYSFSECEKTVHGSRWMEFKRQRAPFQRNRRVLHVIPSASPDDGISVDGTPQVSSGSNMEKIRVRLDQTLQSEDLSSGIVQSIHDAARAIELAFLDHSTSSKSSWFSKTWLGVDKNAWIKSLSYQVEN